MNRTVSRHSVVRSLLFMPLWAILTSPAAAQVPTVSITSPSGAAAISGIVAITVSVQNAVPKHVVLSIDGSVVAKLNAAPYSAQWDSATAPDGAHTLKVTAHDALDAELASATKALTTINQTPALERLFARIRFSELTRDGDPFEQQFPFRIDKSSSLVGRAKLDAADVVDANRDLKDATGKALSSICVTARTVDFGSPPEGTTGKTIPDPKATSFAISTAQQDLIGPTRPTTTERFILEVELWAQACAQPMTATRITRAIPVFASVYGFKLSFSDAYVLVGHTRLRTAEWQSFRVGGNVFFADRIRKGTGIGFFNWFAPRVGLSVTLLDFDPKISAEPSLGVVFSPWRQRALFVGFAYNLRADVRSRECWYLGISGVELKKFFDEHSSK